MKTALLVFFTLTNKCNALAQRNLIRGDNILNNTSETFHFPMSYEYNTPTHTTAHGSSRPGKQIYPATAPIIRNNLPKVIAGSTSQPISRTSTPSITSQGEQNIHSLDGTSAASNQIYPTTGPTTRYESQKYISPISKSTTLITTEESQQKVFPSKTSSEILKGDKHNENIAISTAQYDEESDQQNAIISDSSTESHSDQGPHIMITETQAQKGNVQQKTTQQVQSTATLQTERMITPSTAAVIIGVAVAAAVVLGAMALLFVVR